MISVNPQPSLNQEFAVGVPASPQAPRAGSSGCATVSPASHRPPRWTPSRSPRTPSPVRASVGNHELRDRQPAELHLEHSGTGQDQVSRVEHFQAGTQPDMFADHFGAATGLSDPVMTADKKGRIIYLGRDTSLSNRGDYQARGDYGPEPLHADIDRLLVPVEGKSRHLRRGWERSCPDGEP